MQDLKTWRCGHCPFTVDIPSEQNGYEYADAIARVREHRFGHLVEALTHGSDDDLLRLCDDEPAAPFGGPSSWIEEIAEGLPETLAAVDRALERAPSMAGPVDSEDVTPVLEGITELLRADLPRARRLWYPTNEDGSFNR